MQWIYRLVPVFSMVLVMLLAGGCSEQATSSPVEIEQAQAGQVDDCCAPSGDGQAADCCAAQDKTSASQADQQAATVSPQAVMDRLVSQVAEQVQVADQAADTQAKNTVARAGQWLEADQRGEPFFMGFTVTDQSGKQFQLKELIGKPMAITFLYTRCPDPEMCPMIAAGVAHLQRAVQAAGLGEQVNLVGISYDPVNDTPERLSRYGQQHNLQYTNAMLLRPQVDEFLSLISEFAVDVAPSPDGTIGHRIELILVDHQGRYVRDYQAAIWDSSEVVEDLRKLVGEMPVQAAFAE